MAWPVRPSVVFGAAGRAVRTANWTDRARLLELGGGEATLSICHALRCSGVVCDDDPGRVGALVDRARQFHVDVSVRQVNWATWAWDAAPVDGLLVLTPLAAPLFELARSLRTVLARDGRLLLVWPLRLGRDSRGRSASRHFEERYGEPVPSPREAAQALERAGFEPETVETADTRGLEAYVADVGAAADNPSVTDETREEARLLPEERTVTWGVLCARRKAEGEAPFVVRTT